MVPCLGCIRPLAKRAFETISSGGGNKWREARNGSLRVGHIYLNLAWNRIGSFSFYRHRTAGRPASQSACLAAIRSAGQLVPFNLFGGGRKMLLTHLEHNLLILIIIQQSPSSSTNFNSSREEYNYLSACCCCCCKVLPSVKEADHFNC